MVHMKPFVVLVSQNVPNFDTLPTHVQSLWKGDSQMVNQLQKKPTHTTVQTYLLYHRPLVTLKWLYLGMPKLILCVVHINRPQEFLSSFLVVNELSLWYHTSIQYFVPATKTPVRKKSFFNTKIHLYFLPLLEISILDSAGETFPTDPDSFQHTVTSQLMDNQMVFHNP